MCCAMVCPFNGHGGTAGGTLSAARTLPSSSSTVTWGVRSSPDSRLYGRCGGPDLPHGVLRCRVRVEHFLPARRQPGSTRQPHCTRLATSPPSSAIHHHRDGTWSKCRGAFPTICGTGQSQPGWPPHGSPSCVGSASAAPGRRGYRPPESWARPCRPHEGQSAPHGTGTRARALMELTIDDSLDTAGIGHEHLAGHALGQLAAMGYSFHRFDDA